MSQQENFDPEKIGTVARGIPWGWIAAALFVLVTVTLLFMNNSDSNVQYYMTVAEYLNQQPKYEGKRIKIAGIVKANTLKKTGTSSYRFIAEDSGKEIGISYNGIVPDTFKEGVEVVLEGKGDLAQVFIADNLMAKCASKYKNGGLAPIDQMRGRSRT